MRIDLDKLGIGATTGPKLAWNPTSDAIDTAVDNGEMVMLDDPMGGAEYDGKIPAYPPEGGWRFDREIRPFQIARYCRHLEEEWRSYLEGDETAIHVRKITAILEAWDEGRTEDLPPVVVRQTGTLLDGWHRATVAWNRSKDKHRSGVFVPSITVRW